MTDDNFSYSHSTSLPCIHISKNIAEILILFAKYKVLNGIETVWNKEGVAVANGISELLTKRNLFQMSYRISTATWSLIASTVHIVLCDFDVFSFVIVFSPPLWLWSSRLAPMKKPAKFPFSACESVQCWGFNAVESNSPRSVVNDQSSFQFKVVPLHSFEWRVPTALTTHL